MTRDTLVKQLDSYTYILLPDRLANEIEELLKERNMTLKNLITLFIYNRDTEVDISLMTSPSSNIHLIMPK